MRAQSGDTACRVLNIMAASIGLVMVSPVLLLIALLVWFSSPGPILYRQPRIGIDRRARGVRRKGHYGDRDCGGRPFTILKFRTMHHIASHSDRAVWASPNDARVTMLGRMLRTTRLDELPQLVNVLTGDMNVVGPRPEQPAIVRDLSLRIDGYADRHRVLPGITGLAQITNGYDRTIDDVKKKVALDLEYVRIRSAFSDLRIMASTPMVMLGRRDAW